MLCEILLDSTVIQLPPPAAKPEGGGKNIPLHNFHLAKQATKITPNQRQIRQNDLQHINKELFKIKRKQGLPWCSVARTSHNKFRGPVFIPWSENQFPRVTAKTWHRHIHK